MIPLTTVESGLPMNSVKRSVMRFMRKRIDDPLFLFPGLGQYVGYGVEDFGADFLGGITMFFVLVPQSLAYAELAGMPPQYGIYASTFPLYIYALLGTSRHLVFGPYAVTSFMLGTILLVYPFPPGSTEYIHLALYISFMSGVMFLLIWMNKLGRLINFITPNVTSGFISGSAFLVAMNQVPNLLGFTIPHVPWTHERIFAICNHLKDSTGIAIAFSFPTTIFLYTCGRYKKSRKKPTDGKSLWKYNTMAFFLNISMFIAFVVGTCCSYYVTDHTSEDRLLIVGHVPSSFESSNFDVSKFDHDILVSAIPKALTLTVVAATSNLAVAKRVAENLKYNIDSQNELYSYGIVNVIGALFLNSFINAGGMSRSAVSVESGAKTQASNVISATLVIISLFTSGGTLSYIPKATLGSIIFVSILNMFDYEKVIQLYKKGERLEAAVTLVTMLCVIFLGVSQGLVLGILCSYAAYLYQNNMPMVYPLGVYTLLGEDGMTHFHFAELSQDGAHTGAHVDPACLAREDRAWGRGKAVDGDIAPPTFVRELSSGSSWSEGSSLPFSLRAQQDRAATRALPGMLLARLDSASIYFGNCGFVKKQVMTLAMTSRSSYLQNPQSTSAFAEASGHALVRPSNRAKKVLILDLSSVIHVDDRSVKSFVEMKKKLAKMSNTSLALVHCGWSDDFAMQQGGMEEFRRRSALMHKQRLKHRVILERLEAAGFVSISSANKAALADERVKSGEASKLVTLFSSLERAVQYFTVELVVDCIKLSMHYADNAEGQGGEVQGESPLSRKEREKEGGQVQIPVSDTFSDAVFEAGALSPQSSVFSGGLSDASRDIMSRLSQDSVKGKGKGITKSPLHRGGRPKVSRGSGN